MRNQNKRQLRLVRELKCVFLQFQSEVIEILTSVKSFFFPDFFLSLCKKFLSLTLVFKRISHIVLCEHSLHIFLSLWLWLDKKMRDWIVNTLVFALWNKLYITPRENLFETNKNFIRFDFWSIPYILNGWVAMNPIKPLLFSKFAVLFEF